MYCLGLFLSLKALGSLWLAAPQTAQPSVPRMLLFTPDFGIVVLAVGTLLIFFELNRPGSLVPGMLGLTGVLLALNSWRQWQLSFAGLLSLAFGAALPLWQLRHVCSPWWGFASALMLTIGYATLVEGPPPAHVHLLVAVLCGLSLGSGASLLAVIAARARRNKGLD